MPDREHASFTALLTAFYMFRLLWLTFFGKPRMDEHTAAHVHESPLSMTGVLVVLAILSAVGGFLSIPHFLEGQLPLPVVDEHLHHLETPLIVTSVLIALAGLAGAAWFFGGDALRATRMRERLGGLHRLLSGKYYVDELYEAVLGRPLTWISDRIFLRIGDRALIDGTLHGLAGLARLTAGMLGRVQTGSLHLYAWLVLTGIFACLLWSWHHV